jgi:putative Mg2+ transporter-C (MgtC) family protein
VIELQIVIERIALAALFGALIGIEREWRHRPAGLKTNMLVAVGAAAFAMVSNTFGEANHNPAQMAAAVITGIGFVGAGVIIHRAGSVQGVTTAATLWANAAMAVACGLGQFWVATTVLVCMLIIQFLMRSLERYIATARKEHATHTLELHVTCDPGSLSAVNASWARFATAASATPLRRTTTRRANEVLWFAAFTAAPSSPLNLQPLEEELAALPGVRGVDVRAGGTEEE